MAENPVKRAERAKARLQKVIDGFPTGTGQFIDNEKDVTFEMLCQSVFTEEPVVLRIGKVNIPVVVKSVKRDSLMPSQVDESHPDGFPGATDITFDGIAGRRYVNGAMNFHHDGGRGRCLLWFRDVYAK